MYLDAKRGKRAGIFSADYPRADDSKCFRKCADLENFVRVMHARMLEWELRGTHRRRAGGDKNFLAAQQSIRDDFHAIGIDKAGHAVKRLDLVSAQLLLPAFPVVRD